ncbi:MAG: bifunctional riboflavin kinase/FAD synthetase [Candidatus Omnitrophota bacterium]|nr:bifunctional riboflavin kinase/FAD synthetase [Candidatus Omnitrophota bacterium]
MKTFYGYRNLDKKLRDPVVAIGIFDGIHLGHKRVIKKVLNERGQGSDKVVITFDPHPQTVLRPDKTSPRIMSLEHRLFIFEKMGIDAVVIIRFTDFIAAMSPEDFVKKVLRDVGARKVYVGSNFHFGKRKSGDAKTLEKAGMDCGIDVRTVHPVKKAGRIVSSTWLRRLISAGKIEMAEELLRRPVSVFGTIVGGDKRGGEYGFPTANVDPHQEVIPPPGVYAVKIDIAGKLFDGVLNIGFKPTFYGRKLKKRKEPHIEVHILNFDGDLYGRYVETFFIRRLRREKKFKNAETLKRQIVKDVGKAEKFLSGNKAFLKIKRYKYL